MLENITEGLGHLFSLNSILMINIGMALGIVFGALPGLTATMAIALFLPITFGMDPISGILLLLGLYAGGIYGGSITAILIKTPGTPASAATIMDGYPLAQKGHPGKALHMALVASTVGGIVSSIILLFIAPQVAQFALKFGAPEYFALALFGLTIISSVSGDNIIKGLMMGMIGMLISMIGLDPIGGMPRMNFNIDYLAGGVKQIPVLIGLFAISEILNKVQNGNYRLKSDIEFKNERITFKEFKTSLKTMLKSGAIGSFIGAIPGTGAAIASFLSYNEAKRTSKTPGEFGKGSLEGLAAAEAGNNGVTGATLIPLLTLGVPGDSVTAVLLGALMMQGLVPGPALFANFGDIVYAIMLGFVVVNIFMYLQANYFIKVFVRITQIPINVLMPFLITLCLVGAYAVNNTMFDVYVLLVFGALAYLLNKFDFPLTPMLIAIILGPMAEVNLRRSLIMGEGSYSILFTRPISLTFLIVAALSFCLPFIKSYLINRKEKIAQSRKECRK